MSGTEPKLYPAPWKWNGKFPIRIIGAGGYIVCDSMMPSGAANARLICASPDLLEELVKAHEIIRSLGEWVARHADVSDPIMLVDIRYPERESAIAKAEGK